MANMTADGLRDLLAARLALVESRPASGPGLKPAAVAIAVTEVGEILFTLRASRLNRHGGQYALPGGRLDAGETVEQAALRELHEELGLALGADAVLGRLDDFATRSGYRISPVVAWAGAVEALAPDPGEVAEVYRIPLDELAAPDVLQAVVDPASGDEVKCLMLPTLGHRMYAPSAAILYQFREVAIFGRDTQVADFEQPMFARK